MIAINWLTRRITIPQADLTPISGTLYEIDVNEFRISLKDIEDSEEGIGQPDTHRHNTQVTLSGVTYARTFEIINGYTVEFQDTGTPYLVRCVGANHNLADVYVPGTSGVSLIIGNAAGLVVTDSGGGPSPESIADAVHTRAVEGAITLEQAMRVLLSALAGDATGLDGESQIFKSLDGTKDRIVGTVVDGARTVTSRDGT
jgi:hypothetical protein